MSVWHLSDFYPRFIQISIQFSLQMTWKMLILMTSWNSLLLKSLFSLKGNFMMKVPSQRSCWSCSHRRKWISFEYFWDARHSSPTALKPHRAFLLHCFFIPWKHIQRFVFVFVCFLIVHICFCSTAFSFPENIFPDDERLKISFKVELCVCIIWPDWIWSRDTVTACKCH